jgi:DNA gyrase subunit A
VNFVGIESGERICAITPVSGFNEGLFVTTLTRKGQIKKTAVTDYQNFREKGIIGVKITDDDQLLAAAVTDGTREFLIATRNGKSIRFDEQQVRAMGRAAAGVKGIELEDDDFVVGFACTDPEREQVLTICERGYGKRTSLEEFRAQRRGGKGIILIDASDRNGPVVGIALVRAEDDLMLVTNRGQTIRTRVSEIRETGRNAQGVRVMNVEDDERVVAIEALQDKDDDELDLAAAAAAAAVAAEGGVAHPVALTEDDADGASAPDESDDGSEDSAEDAAEDSAEDDGASDDTDESTGDE